MKHIGHSNFLYMRVTRLITNHVSSPVKKMHVHVEWHNCIRCNGAISDTLFNIIGFLQGNPDEISPK